MLAKADKKLLRSLSRKKNRLQERLFLAEGPKVIADLLAAGLQPQSIWSTDPENWPQAKSISGAELQQVSQLKTAHEVIAIFPFLREQGPLSYRVLVLDKINDPGNLGTLVRTADWFGFHTVWCMPGTADIYNGKTVQSTMGSLARVQVLSGSLQELRDKLSDYQFYLADMSGTPLHQCRPQADQKIAFVLGSESHGPVSDWAGLAEPVTIQAPVPTQLDSLNVAVAGALGMYQLSLEASRLLR